MINNSGTFQPVDKACAVQPLAGIVTVRYHGEGSKELNAFTRFLLHMVYL